MSAVSSMFSPASRQISTSRVASATSLDPQALKNSFPPPNVPVPKLRTGTFNPEPPNCRYSIFIPEFELAPEVDAPPPAPSRIKSIPATPTPHNHPPTDSDLEPWPTMVTQLPAQSLPP